MFSLNLLSQLDRDKQLSKCCLNSFGDAGVCSVHLGLRPRSRPWRQSSRGSAFAHVQSLHALPASLQGTG